MPKYRPNLLLKYYTEVTKSDQLHFGYWLKGEELNMKNLLVAQERYAEHLIDFIPEKVKKVLDVGCGVGGNALRLKKRGYDVASLSPDPFQEGVYKKNTNNEIPFFLSKFEDFNTNEKFDLIFMSESSQYIDLKEVFERSKKLLNEKGYLLVCDFFKIDGLDDHGMEVSGHLQKKYLEQSEVSGFKIVKSENITENIMPTLDYMVVLFKDYLIPCFKMIPYAIQNYIPFFYPITRFLFAKSIKRSIERSLVSGENFAKYRTYMIYLFQKQ